MLEWIINEISSLPSDTQWIDKLEKEIEEEDKDIDSLDDYYMGMHVGKSSMLNRIRDKIFAFPLLVSKLDTLDRYHYQTHWMILEYDKNRTAWVFIRYDDLKKLLLQ